MIMADVIVFNAVSGGCVHTAGAAVQCDMAAENNERFTLKERMGCFDIFQFAALKGRYDLITVFSRFMHGFLVQSGCHNIIFAAAFDQRIFKIRSQADRHIGGESPCCRRPDHEKDFVRIDPFRAENPAVIGYAEFYINGITRILAVLDFRLSQSRFVVRAPVNWLKALVNVAFQGHLAEHFDLLSFKLRIQSDIWMLPVADYTETLKLRRHSFHVGQRKITAVIAEIHRVAASAVEPVGINRLPLNGQAVCIPPGNIRCAESGHILIPDNNIF